MLPSPRAPLRNHSVSGKGTKRKYDWAEASVNGVPVLKANVHVGKTVAHGIGSVLTPDAAAKVSTEKAPAAKTGSRKLLQSQWGFQAGATAEQDDISSQIANAVAGNESAAQVARQGTLRK